ncbi:MAG: hypothetical protein JNJ47_05590, partial [Alphaproteobacteria bacterium]|nr:hypothetical protein [Alphaproteobacteria bacterium]
IERSIQALNKLAENSRLNIFLRWHPSHIGDLSIAMKFISRKIILDDPLQTPIGEVMKSSSVFVGLGSSVLLEGAYKGKEIIVLKNKLVEDVSAYHYMYNMKNVKIVEVDDLYDHLISVLKFSKPC